MSTGRHLSVPPLPSLGHNNLEFCAHISPKKSHSPACLWHTSSTCLLGTSHFRQPPGSLAAAITAHSRAPPLATCSPAAIRPGAEPETAATAIPQTTDASIDRHQPPLTFTSPSRSAFDGGCPSTQYTRHRPRRHTPRRTGTKPPLSHSHPPKHGLVWTALWSPDCRRVLRIVFPTGFVVQSVRPLIPRLQLPCSEAIHPEPSSPSPSTVPPPGTPNQLSAGLFAALLCNSSNTKYPGIFWPIHIRNPGRFGSSWIVSASPRSGWPTAIFRFPSLLTPRRVFSRARQNAATPWRDDVSCLCQVRCGSAVD